MSPETCHHKNPQKALMFEMIGRSMEGFGFMWRIIRSAENVKLGRSEFHCPQ